MQTATVEAPTKISSAFIPFIDDPNTKMPTTIAKVLSPLATQLGTLKVIHPTTNDPVLISSKLGPIAIWFTF